MIVEPRGLNSIDGSFTVLFRPLIVKPYLLRRPSLHIPLRHAARQPELIFDGSI